MGPAREVAEDRKNGGVQGRSRRGAHKRAASRIDQADGLSAGERLDAEPHVEGLANGKLDAVDETNIRYRGLRLKAEAALELLITAKGVPANVRASAVRTALELVGAIGARSKDQRDQEDADGSLDPESLSVADIDREIGKLGRV